MPKNVVTNTAIILSSSVGPRIISRIGKMAIFGSGYNAANSGPKAALTGRKAPISSPTAIPATAPRPPPTSRRSRVGQVWDHSSPSSAISVAAAAIRLGDGKNREQEVEGTLPVLLCTRHPGGLEGASLAQLGLLLGAAPRGRSGRGRNATLIEVLLGTRVGALLAARGAQVAHAVSSALRTSSRSSCQM